MLLGIFVCTFYVTAIFVTCRCDPWSLNRRPVIVAKERHFVKTLKRQHRNLLKWATSCVCFVDYRFSTSIRIECVSLCWWTEEFQLNQMPKFVWRNHKQNVFFFSLFTPFWLLIRMIKKLHSYVFLHGIIYRRNKNSQWNFIDQLRSISSWTIKLYIESKRHNRVCIERVSSSPSNVWWLKINSANTLRARKFSSIRAWLSHLKAI